MSAKKIMVGRNKMYDGFSPNIVPKNRIDTVTLGAKTWWMESDNLDMFTGEEQENDVGSDEGYRKYIIYEQTEYEPFANLSCTRVSEIGNDISKKEGILSNTDTPIQNVETKYFPYPDASKSGDRYEDRSVIINDIKLSFKVPEFTRIPQGDDGVFALNASYHSVGLVWRRYVSTSPNISFDVVKEQTFKLNMFKTLSLFKYDNGWTNPNIPSFELPSNGYLYPETGLHPFFNMKRMEVDYDNSTINIYLNAVAYLYRADITTFVPFAVDVGIQTRMMTEASFHLTYKYYEADTDTEVIKYVNPNNVGFTHDITNPLFDFIPIYVKPDSTHSPLYKDVAESILRDYGSGRVYGNLITCYGKFYDENGVEVLSGADGKIIEPLDKVALNDVAGFNNFCLITKSELDLAGNKLYLDFIRLNEHNYKHMSLPKTELSFLITNFSKTLQLNFSKNDSSTLTVDWGDGQVTTSSVVGSVQLSHSYATNGIYNVKAWISSGTGKYSMGWAYYEPFIPSDFATFLKDVIIGEDTTYIEQLSFSNCSSLKSVKISKNVTNIGEYAFNGCPLEVVEVHNEVPPTLYHIQSFGNRDNVIIKVPQHAVSAYRVATNWVYFADRIQPL